MEFYLHKPGVSLKSIRCQDVFSGTIAPPVALSPPSHVSRECCMVWRTSLYEVAKGLDWIGLDEVSIIYKGVSHKKFRNICDWSNEKKAKA
jgi:hypothetical protein